MSHKWVSDDLDGFNVLLLAVVICGLFFCLDIFLLHFAGIGVLLH